MRKGNKILKVWDSQKIAVLRILYPQNKKEKEL